MSFFQPWLLGGLGKKKKKKGERYSPRWNTPQTWSVRSTGSQICHSRPAAGRQWSCSSWGWVWAGATVWQWRAGPGRRSGTGASSLLWLYHKNWQIYKKTVQIRRIFIIVICEGIYPRYWHVPLVIHSQVYSSESVSWHLILTCTCSFGWSLCGLISPLKGALDMTGRKTDCVL